MKEIKYVTFWVALTIFFVALYAILGYKSPKSEESSEIIGYIVIKFLSTLKAANLDNSFSEQHRPYSEDDEYHRQLSKNSKPPDLTQQDNISNLLPDFFLDEPRDASQLPPRNKTEGGKIPTLFASITKSISPELIQKTQAVYQFNVKGKEEGVWHLDLKNGDGSCGQGEPKNPPDATLTMDSGNFADMFAGKLKPATAFMMGKLKISGDLQKAMKLEKMMKSLKNKM